MNVTCISEWSFGRDSALNRSLRPLLENVIFHDLHSSAELNRTWLAISGSTEAVSAALLSVAGQVFPRIDLSHHVTSFPRLGALDRVLWVGSPGSFASEFAALYSVPVFVAPGPTEIEAETLSEGGFGSLGPRELEPDFGPSRSHPAWGITRLFSGGFEVQVLVKIAPLEITGLCHLVLVQSREAGDPRLLGVESIPAPEWGLLHLRLTLPDLASIDPVLGVIEAECRPHGGKIQAAWVVGGLRERDRCQQATFRNEQVIDLSL